MSKRYWIAAVAFGVAALCSAIFWWWIELSEYQVQHANQRQESASNEAGAVEKYKRCLLHGGHALDFIACLYEAGTPQSEASYAKYDLEAQQDMAEFAFSAMIASIIGVVFSGIGIAALMYSLELTRRAVKSADDAVEVTREMGMKQVRAYVFHDGVVVKWQGDAIEHIAFVWKNSGQSPAKNVVVNTYLTIIRPPIWVDGMSEANLEEFETSSRENVGGLARISQGSLPPGGDLKTMSKRITANDVAEWRLGRCAIIAHATVTYVDEFNKDRHSRCCYRLVYEDSPSRNITHFERLSVGNSYK